MEFGIGIIITSLIFLVMITIVYLTKKNVENMETEMYNLLIATALVNGIIELLLCLNIVFNVESFSTYNIFLNRIFLIFIFSWISFFLIYFLRITIVTYKLKYDLSTIYKAVAAVSIVLSIGLLTLPLKLFDNGVYAYSYGPAPDLLMSIVLVYSIFCFIVSMLYIKKNPKKYIPVIVLSLILITILIVRHINPGILLNSSGFMIVTVLMFHTIENPDMRMIDALNVAKNEADRANRAKSDFLSSMSHEIRTPLNAIVGLSEDIQDHHGIPEAIKEDANDIVNASHTLLEIIGNIIDVSKIESNKLDIVNLPYNFREELEALVRMNKTRIGEKDLRLEVNIANDIPYQLIGDKPHIKQILTNIISNGIKYTDKGIVRINAKCINQNGECLLIISVQDTGRGIKAEKINRLFNQFDRLDAEKNSTIEGTGLGLAITKKLVELMNGKINVQSQFGIGSLFVIQLPQRISLMSAPKTAIIEESEFNTAMMTDRFKNKKILIVDDNKLNIKVAKRALDEFDFILDECETGKECIEKIESGVKYDLILMDIMMPEMSGETAFKKLQKIEGFDTPTFALTADAIDGAREKYLKEGFVDYISKPFTKDQIRRKLEEIFK